MRALSLTGVPGKFTRRLLSITLLGEAMVVLFGGLVARGFAVAEGDGTSATTYLVGGALLAALCLLAVGLLRRPFGITLGWLVQVLTLASAVVLPAMVFVTLIFGALWVVCLVQGHKMEELSRRWAEEHRHGEGNHH